MIGYSQVIGRVLSKACLLSCGQQVKELLGIVCKSPRIAIEGLLRWNGEVIQLPQPVAVNQGPRLFSDSVMEDRE